METMRIGILGTSDVASRRFLPALKRCPCFTYVGTASRDAAKAKHFANLHGGKGFLGYETLLTSDEVDALYIPLPPVLHYHWAKKALEHGKHVLLEKPFTTNLDDTKDLIGLAKKQGLALHENYTFIYHQQLAEVQRILAAGVIGDIRLIRAAFGFPFRGFQDFRYSKELGGGALFDCGGYPIRLGSFLLGESARVIAAQLEYIEGIDVDLFGSATLENDAGSTTQIAFGMDNSYKCELEVWGNKGCLLATRIFTAPPEYQPEIILTIDGKSKSILIMKDDQFLNSISAFYEEISDMRIAKLNYKEILRQSRLIEDVLYLS